MDISIRDLLRDQKDVVTLTTKHTVEDALNILATRGITSAPLLGESGNILGFLDVVDLVTYLVRLVSKRDFPSTVQLDGDQMYQIAKTGKEFNLAQLMEVILSSPKYVEDILHKEKETDIARHDAYFPLQEDNQLKDAIPIFLKNIHRIAVTNKDGKIVHILSQSDLIRHLAKHPELMGPLRAEQVISSGLMQKSVISVSPDSLTLDAFKKMDSHHVSSLGVELEGVLVGTLSASDIKGIQEKELATLLQPVSKFLSEIRKQQGRSASEVVTCPPISTLQTVVKTLAEERVHRVFVVDNSMKPIGVVSNTDIIKELFRSPAK